MGKSSGRSTWSRSKIVEVTKGEEIQIIGSGKYTWQTSAHFGIRELRGEMR